MKTEEEDDAAQDVHDAAAAAAAERIGPEAAGSGARLQPPQRRTVCDHCRRRRIRCDGQFPCRQCLNASLTCKRDHVPRKRGPKRGHGRVINELRAKETKEKSSRESSAEYEVSLPSVAEPAKYRNSLDMDSVRPETRSATTSIPSTPSPQDISWNKNLADPRNAPEPRSMFTSDAYLPNSRCYFHLIPQCVELYYEHIYPIMPLLYMPAIRSMIARPMTPSEKNLVYALCALTCLHMSGKSLQTPGAPPSWEAAGRYFLDECISVRHSYDFVEDLSLFAVISSFWLSTSFFEINQNRKSWVYLREALTLALDLDLQNDRSYAGLSPEETLCRQRVFWILFVTERSFAILRNKPITFKKTPSLPTSGHSYESPDINTGFLQLISSYTPLDESFVTAWNEGSDPRVSANTYLTLQNLLSRPPAFLSRTRPSSPSAHRMSTGIPSRPTSAGVEPSDAPLIADDDDEPTPTEIQKADLLITQQWLRLIVWQSSFRQGLLSWAAPHESMHFAFPLAIARRTAGVLSSLPSSAVEVHGMGMFEKIFEIGTWCINVLGACDSASAAGTPIAEINHTSMVGFGSSGGGIMGMDFVGGASGGDLGILGLSRKGVAVDPLEFFVRTLSASPNSRTQFADRLLMFAQERPGGMRMSLSPVLTLPSPAIDEGPWSAGAAMGRAVEEVKEESDAEAGLPGYEMSGALGDVFSDPLPPASLGGAAGDAISSDNVIPMSGFFGAQEASTSMPPSFTGWSSGDVGQEMGMTFHVVPTVEEPYLTHSGEISPVLSRNNSGTSLSRRSDQRVVVVEEGNVPRMHDMQHRSGSHQDLGVYW